MQFSIGKGWILLAATLLALGLAIPSFGQHDDLTPKARAKAEVESRHEREHKHTKLKQEGGAAVGGAVAGGVVGGPAGAFAGAKLGHGAGSLFHGVRKHQEVKKQLKADEARRHRRAAHPLVRRTTTTAH